MTSKEQERKALEKIRKIVEELGENSYVGTAFEGCFEDAEYNIRDDAAYSMKSRWESAKASRDELELKVKDQADQIKRCQAANENIRLYLDEKDKALNTKDYRIAELSASLKEVSHQCTEHWNHWQEAEKKLDEKEDEIIRLKAKLYDLMCPPENMPLSTNSGLQSLEELLGNG